MVVQHNLKAMNANRMLNINTKASSHSTEKLSSGYRVNRQQMTLQDLLYQRR